MVLNSELFSFLREHDSPAMKQPAAAVKSSRVRSSVFSLDKPSCIHSPVATSSFSRSSQARGQDPPITGIFA